MHHKNLFSIGEIAKAVGITRKIILNYEAKGLIAPDQKDGSTGNRYYTIDTFTQIRTIRLFQNLGLSLDEIHDYFNDTVDLIPFIKRMEFMRDSMNSIIEKLYERVDRNKNNPIRKIWVEPQTVYVKKHTTHNIDERTVLLRETALEAMHAYETDISRQMYYIEYPLSDTDALTYAVSIASDSRGESVCHMPGFPALSVFHHGAYEEIPRSREKLVAYAKENHCKLTGTCRHIYLEGPPQHKDPSKFITQILLPLEE